MALTPFGDPLTVLGATSVLLEDPHTAEGFARGTMGDRERVHSAARSEALGFDGPRDERRATWAYLAALGRRDLVLARLVEGHVDAVGILAEAGRKPFPGAVYGVWASGSGGTGLTAEPVAGGFHVSGTLRYATGARWVDRVLVTARTPSAQVLLLDLAVGEGWEPLDGTWRAVGMDLSDSLDVEVDVAASLADGVGSPGFYLDRPGFPLGGIGVAAVWLGGAAGVLDAVTAGLRRFEPDPHQLAHLGALTVAVAQADAVLARAADEPGDPATAALLCRAAVDAAVTEVLTRAPRLTGPTPLCRDGDFAHRLADLQVYVRQQHAERDLAALGRAALDG
ncbi:acyl-CoA dehydrogenase [Spongisporangium articulatum]|uniref:Acyl-CoA dehydrogenase n=1 Tax=Spongisporangium articulatum TaxID=3362603 RepID=A0ABW8AHV6_9ACTN